MNGRKSLALLVAVAVLSGCANLPAGPGVMVLPAPGKSFTAFQADDGFCRQWAAQQTGAPPADTANRTLADGAVIGTLLGVGLGAAIGAASGNVGSGAAIGAAGGLLGGTLAATEPAYAVGWEAQRRYDIAYQQCMYAKGNQIPGSTRPPARARWVPPPPPPGYFVPPPPPGGYPPGPPPDLQ
jgi:hypothetical protein